MSNQVDIMQDAIIFEQPLNEYIRVCLRLEHLFALIEANLQGQTEWECRSALSALLEALNVIDRPDLKNKITKALTQHAYALSQLTEKPQVDRERLQAVLADLEKLVNSLYESPDKMGQKLRNNNFLNSIRQQLLNPGGAAAFSTPAYHLWLQHPKEVRTQHLTQWYGDLEQIRTATRLLLQLTRGSNVPQSLLAVQGFYQQSLDPRLPYHLVRVTAPLKEQVYPEISVGKHRLIIRFLALDIYDRPQQTTRDIVFDLTCCLPLVT